MAVKQPKKERTLDPAHRVFIDLVRTQSQKMREVNALLSKHNLTAPQYNALRILRGAGDDGLPCRKISDRMLTQVSDVTRIVDRLVTEGHATREQSTEDRRVVLIRISGKGLGLLAEVDSPILELHAAQFANLTKSELKEFGRLLRKAQEN